MTNPKDLIQEKFVTKADNPNPDYARLLNAYVDNPLYDLTVRPEEEAKRKNLKGGDSA